MARTTHTVVVVGTTFGDRNQLIQLFAQKGTVVELRRERGSRDPDAVGVWLRCSRFGGLWKTWAHIGYVKPDPSNPWAQKLDAGEMLVEKAWVHSAFAPLERSYPEVKLRVVVNDVQAKAIPRRRYSA